MNSKICEAIKSKAILKIFYKEKEIRKIEPFCYGVGGSGKEFLRAWQISGFSNHKSDIPNWRLFVVDNISNLEVSSEHFNGNRPGYNPNDSVMSQIYSYISS